MKKAIIKWMEKNITLVFVILFMGLGLWLLPFHVIISEGQLYNETYLVNTTLNITNAAPIITAITFQSTIDLRSYNTTNITCNVSVFDFDNDTVLVNATVYLVGISTPTSPNDNNNHYTNLNCSRISPQNLNMNYSCEIPMQYYADNSSQWICNATVSDGGQVPTGNESNYGTVNSLLAIKMDPILDYGDLEVGQTSGDTLANVTNAGNRDANISVDGYGGVDGDGLSFNCTFGSIILDYERYDVVSGTAFGAMTLLTDASTTIPNFNVPQRINDTYDSMNATFWKVQIPVGAGGVCNGKILFSATDRG